MPGGRGLQELRLDQFPISASYLLQAILRRPYLAAWDIPLPQVLHQEVIEEVLVRRRGLVAP